MLWGLQHCGHEWDSGFPEKEARPPVARVSLGETRGVGDGFPRVLGTSTGAVAGSGTQAAPVVVVGGHERAAGGDGCHALACGLVETSAATPSGRALARDHGGLAIGHGAHLQKSSWEAAPPPRHAGLVFFW